MSTEISAENEAFIHDLIERQEYTDRGAVIDDALKWLRERRDLQTKISLGISELDAGNFAVYDASKFSDFRADIEAAKQEDNSRK